MYAPKRLCWLVFLLSAYASAGEVFLNLRRFELTCFDKSLDGHLLCQCIIVVTSDTPEREEETKHREKGSAYWIVRDKNKNFKYRLNGLPSFNSFSNKVLFELKEKDETEIECSFSAVSQPEDSTDNSILAEHYAKKYPTESGT